MRLVSVSGLCVIAWLAVFTELLSTLAIACPDMSAPWTTIYTLGVVS